MAKGVILLTDKGVKLMGSIQCSNGSYFDAEGCFNYCNGEKSELLNKHQANKLVANATSLNVRENAEDEDWYKNRENFKDVEIDYNVDQTYKW